MSAETLRQHSTSGLLTGIFSVGINDLGQVVGFAYNPSSPGSDLPFLYSDGQVWDLNTLIDPGQKIRLNDATALNNRGQIVATGFGPGPELDRVYVLTPISSPVPEPNILATLGLAFTVLLVAKRRNKKLGLSEDVPKS